jgi:AcrR family transcriptional regulator
MDHAGKESSARVRERMQARMADGESPFSALVNEYLSALHMAEMELGCPVAALSSDMQRVQDTLREGARSRVRALAAAVEATLPPGAAPGSAWAVTASMVGAIQLARVLGPEGGGSEVLQSCRESLLAQYG